MPSPAIYFHADAVESKGKDLVGRRSSGQSFLKGFLRHVPSDTVQAVVSNKAASVAFDQAARALGETRPIKVNSLRGQVDFTAPGTIFFPGPGYVDAAWRRQRFGPANCSLVGIAHTVSTRRVVEGLHTLLLEPVEPWDAIICTSRAVQSVVQRQMALEAEYITRRFGAKQVPLPQLPLIPLGINTDDFDPDPAQRGDLRARFGATDDAFVVMTMGRLTAVEKANPVPLFLALEELAQTSGKPVHLWMVGWSSRKEEEELHHKGAAQICPSVKISFIDGRAADVRRHIWGAADVFTLPVDNVQETFGLVPVEAMAASLPVVMPDWNGFRDTVVDGKTGFLIPTAMTGAGSRTGARLAERFADGTDGYLHYLSILQQQTAIDLRAYVAAFARLMDDAALRKEMGNAGRSHARKTFDWAAIIPQYLSLADDLAAMRRNAQPTSPRLASGPMNPIEVDPFDLYARYPTHSVNKHTEAIHRRELDAEYLAKLDAVNGRDLYQRRIVADAEMLRVADMIAQQGKITVLALASKTKLSPDIIAGIVTFLAKFDFVTLNHPGTK